MAVTWTCGGTMSGNCATGMRVNAIRPAIVMTSAMTTASRGRSTKIAEITDYPPAAEGGGLAGPGETTSLGTDALHALGNDQLPFLEPARHDRRRGRRLAEMDAPDLRPILLIDDVDIVALLVGQHRGARDRQYRDRLHAFEQYGDEFLVRELSKSRLSGLCGDQHRVRDHAAQGDRVGVLVDGRRDVIELADLLIDLPGSAAAAGSRRR